MKPGLSKLMNSYDEVVSGPSPKAVAEQWLHEHLGRGTDPVDLRRNLVRDRLVIDVRHLEMILREIDIDLIRPLTRKRLIQDAVRGNRDSGVERVIPQLPGME